MTTSTAIKAIQKIHHIRCIPNIEPFPYHIVNSRIEAKFLSGFPYLLFCICSISPSMLSMFCIWSIIWFMLPAMPFI